LLLPQLSHLFFISNCIVFVEGGGGGGGGGKDFFSPRGFNFLIPVATLS